MEKETQTVAFIDQIVRECGTNRMEAAPKAA
jgi:hypothetical protein